MDTSTLGVLRLLPFANTSIFLLLCKHQKRRRDILVLSALRNRRNKSIRIRPWLELSNLHCKEASCLSSSYCLPLFSLSTRLTLSSYLFQSLYFSLSRPHFLFLFLSCSLFLSLLIALSISPYLFLLWIPYVYISHTVCLGQNIDIIKTQSRNTQIFLLYYFNSKEILDRSTIHQLRCACGGRTVLRSGALARSGAGKDVAEV